MFTENIRSQVNQCLGAGGDAGTVVSVCMQWRLEGKELISEAVAGDGPVRGDCQFCEKIHSGCQGEKHRLSQERFTFKSFR